MEIVIKRITGVKLTITVTGLYCTEFVSCIIQTMINQQATITELKMVWLPLSESLSTLNLPVAKTAAVT